MKRLLVFVVLVVLVLSGCSSFVTPTSIPTMVPTVIPTPTLIPTITPIPTPTLIPTPTMTPTPMPIQLSSIELEKAVWAASELKGGLEFADAEAQTQLYLDVVESFAVSPSLRNYWKNLKVSPNLEGVLAYLRENQYFLPGKAGNEELKYLISTKAHRGNCSTFSTPNLQRGIYLDGIRVALALPWNWKDPRVKDFLGYSNLRGPQNRSTNGWEASLVESFGLSDAMGFLITDDARIIVVSIQVEDAYVKTGPGVLNFDVSESYPDRIPTIVAGTIYSYLDCFRRIGPNDVYYVLFGQFLRPTGCGYNPGISVSPPYFKLSPEGLK